MMLLLLLPLLLLCVAAAAAAGNRALQAAQPAKIDPTTMNESSGCATHLNQRGPYRTFGAPALALAVALALLAAAIAKGAESLLLLW